MVAMSQAPEFDVIVCGSLHLDIIVHAEVLPRIDETAVGRAWQHVCGGKGGNQAVQAAKFGAKTAMIGRIGNEQFGQTLLENLQASRVDTTAVETDLVHGSGMSVAILQSDGNYGAVIVSGSNLHIDVASIQNHWHALGGARVLILQNEVPEPVNVAMAKCARQQGATVMLNAAPARPLSKELETLVDVLVVNRVEAEMMSGLGVNDRASAVACLQALGSDERSIIVTLGGEGVVLGEKARLVHEIEAVPVKVSSTHGAGDCFVGVMAACLAQGQNLHDASNIANKAAAAHVQRQV